MNILVTAPYSETALRKLELFGSVHYYPWKDNNKGRANNPEEVKQLLRKEQADALIIEHDVVSADVFDEFPLKFLGVCRGTPSNVDVAAATAKSIPVFYTPARNAQAVAELVIAGLIGVQRNMRQGMEWLESGAWTADSHESYLKFRGSEIAGKTVGMVGFGAVGQTIAKLLYHFPCEIQYYDPYVPTPPDAAYHACSLEDLFATSDIVSIHLPVTAETADMIGARLIDMMKPGAIFVNSARAAVVERNALYAALLQRRIGGAVLDVFYKEPPDAADLEIARLPYVIATPHMAGNTFEVDEYHADIMLRALHEWTHGKREQMKLLVNPAVLRGTVAP